MSVIAIDPGPVSSAMLIWDGERIVRKDYAENWEVINTLQVLKNRISPDPDPCVIEMIGHYGTGMPAGAEVFDTCVWIGRFMEAYGAEKCALMKRAEVKMHLCGSMRAKDPNIRQAIIDRFGRKEAAIGRKANPGPLFGVAGDAWAALALALTWWDERKDIR